MRDLPARPDLDQLRHQARELLRAAQGGNAEATARVSAVSGRLVLSSAQLALAREYGFETWAQLKHHIEAVRPAGMEQLERLVKELARLGGLERLKDLVPPVVEERLRAKVS